MVCLLTLTESVTTVGGEAADTVSGVNVIADNAITSASVSENALCLNVSNIFVPPLVFVLLQKTQSIPRPTRIDSGSPATEQINALFGNYVRAVVVSRRA
jgi:hypothetical protein